MEELVKLEEQMMVLEIIQIKLVLEEMDYLLQ